MKTKIALDSLHLFYGDFQALKGITMDIAENQITAFIGPSGCGKSTCIKTLNRMNDLVAGCRITGKVSIDGEDIYDPRTDVTLLRKRAGMVFQKPNPFPMSIYDNIAYVPTIRAGRRWSIGAMPTAGCIAAPTAYRKTPLRPFAAPSGTDTARSWTCICCATARSPFFTTAT